MAGKTELILELTECGMKLLWVRRRRFHRTPNHLKVDCEWLPVPQGESWEQVLQSYLAQRNRKDSMRAYPIPTTLLLPITKAFVREFQVPPVSRNKMRQMVKYLVDEEVPLPESDRVYDFEECSKGRIVIGAIRRTQLTHMVDVLHQLGLKVVRVDFAALRIAALLSLGPDETALFFEQSEHTFTFGVFRGNTPEIYRHFPLNSDNWESEVWAQIHYYQHAPLPEINKIVAIGSGTENWAKVLLKDGRATEFMKLKGQEVFDSYLNRSRLSLPPLNLLQDFALQKKYSSSKKIAASLTVLGIALGLALSGNAYRHVTDLKNHIANLEMEIDHIHQSVATEKNQWQEWIAIHHNSPQLGREMMTLQRLIPPGIEVERIELSGSSLYFAGSASRGSEVQELMVKLKQLGWDKTALLHFSRQPNEKLSFTLSSVR